MLCPAHFYSEFKGKTSVCKRTQIVAKCIEQGILSSLSVQSNDTTKDSNNIDLSLQCSKTLFNALPNVKRVLMKEIDDVFLRESLHLYINNEVIDYPFYKRLKKFIEKQQRLNCAYIEKALAGMNDGENKAKRNLATIGAIDLENMHGKRHENDTLKKSSVCDSNCFIANPGADVDLRWDLNCEDYEDYEYEDEDDEDDEDDSNTDWMEWREIVMKQASIKAERKFKLPLLYDLKNTHHIIDQPNGCKLVEMDETVFAFVPREISICEGNRLNEIIALDTILKNTNPSPRSNNKLGISKHYAIIGARPTRIEPGIRVSFPDTIKNECETIFCSMAQRAEKCAKAVMPPGALEGLKHAREVVGWQMPSITPINEFNNSTLEIWPSCAISCNYVSAAHIDKDMFLSMITVACSANSYKDNNYYEYHMPVALHFVLPEYGIAVALRPGDHILFNPQVYHCLSMREPAYYHEKVFVSSFYLKTAVVGGNDINIPLTLQQEQILKYIK